MSLERRRRERRRGLLLRWLVLLACLAIVVLAVLIGVRGCGQEVGGQTTDTHTTTNTTTSGSSTSTDVSRGTTTTSRNEGSVATSAVEVATKSSPDVTVAEYDPSEPGDSRVAGTFYGPINTAFAGLTMFRRKCLSHLLRRGTDPVGSAGFMEVWPDGRRHQRGAAVPDRDRVDGAAVHL